MMVKIIYAMTLINIKKVTNCIKLSSQQYIERKIFKPKSRTFGDRTSFNITFKHSKIIANSVSRTSYQKTEAQMY